MTYYVITNDQIPAKSCFVRTNEKGISSREFLGGFRRFLRELYSEKNLEEIDGCKSLSLKEFDRWCIANKLC